MTVCVVFFFFFKQKTAYEMRISDWSSDVCSSDLPIEKKPLNHFLPGTPVLSFGTAGCNLTCKFCQNWDISKSREMDRLMDQAPPQIGRASCRERVCQYV